MYVVGGAQRKTRLLRKRADIGAKLFIALGLVVLYFKVKSIRKNVGVPPSGFQRLAAAILLQQARNLSLAAARKRYQTPAVMCKGFPVAARHLALTVDKRIRNKAAQIAVALVIGTKQGQVIGRKAAARFFKAAALGDIHLAADNRFYTVRFA